ncbi:hypothetical protein F0562_012491 [Nyssa sinensis]|uniref:CWZF3/5/7 THD domain-containing protein n=1 Tax=Nyssa sinensis TaxID=561372 RepID=A0A5J4ZW11_9ASTE|nr:hypothetical protein F0562_012491 [Nyssa sinensis]
MAYYHSEALLYTGSWDKTVKVWRVSDSRCIDSFVAHEDNVNAILVNQEDDCVFSCSSDGSVKIWRRVYGQSSHILTMTLKFQRSSVYALALSTSLSSSFLYSGSSDGFINFWEKEKTSGRFNHGGFMQGHRFAVLCLVAIEKLIFSGSEDTTIRVWRREEGSCFHECLVVLDARRGPVKCLAASQEMEKVMMGFLVYSASFDQTFKVWRVKVLPDEKMGSNGVNHSELKMKIMEYEMSPVLSPSWMGKKGDRRLYVMETVKADDMLSWVRIKLSKTSLNFSSCKPLMWYPFVIGESPSSSASDVDNLNNPTTVDKGVLAKGVSSPQVAGNYFTAARNRSNFVHLLNFVSIYRNSDLSLDVCLLNFGSETQIYL